MRTDQLQDFVRDAVAPPPLGAIVEVTESFEYYADWAGEKFVVVGHELKHDGRVNITIADFEKETPWRGWNGRTDGFQTADLRVVRSPSSAHSEEKDHA